VLTGPLLRASCLGGGGCKALSHLVPADQVVYEGGFVVGAAVLVVQIVRMLPHVLAGTSAQAACQCWAAGASSGAGGCVGIWQRRLSDVWTPILGGWHGQADGERCTQGWVGGWWECHLISTAPRLLPQARGARGVAAWGVSGRVHDVQMGGAERRQTS
jgi:hypothetical protein